MSVPKEFVEGLTRGLVDRGKLIEAGWISLRYSVMDPDAPQIQVDEMRMAFFAGAQHLFASIMIIMDAEAEPTQQDLKRMNLISAELDEFIQQFEARHGIDLDG